MSAPGEISDEYFVNMLREWAASDNSNLYELDEKIALLKFRTETKRTQPLYIVHFKTFVEFSVQSVAWYHAEEDIPRVLSTYLLKRNAKLRIGFWCVEEIEGDYCFSCMHRADKHLVDTEYMGKVTGVITKEVDDFDAMYIRTLRELGKIK